MLMLGLCAALLAACATARPEPPRAIWQCDPDLDAAVARGEWEDALEGHRQLVRQNPDNCLAIYHLGYIWGHLGDRSREVAAYEQAIACGYDGDDRLYFNLGMAYGDLEDLERATEALTTAIDLNPDNGDNYFGLALIADAAGRPDDAEQALIRASAVDPAHLEAHLELVRRYLDQGRWEEARSRLAVIQAMDPNNVEARALQHLLESRQSTQYNR